MKNRQGKLFHFVIFAPNNIETESKYKFLFTFQDMVKVNAQRENFRLSSMIHDNDIDDNGELKPIHLHIVVRSQKVLRISTILYSLGYFSDDFEIKVHGNDIDLPPIITAEIGKNEVGLTRYLFHLDNPEKAQYCTFDFFSTTNEEFVNYCLTLKNYDIFSVEQLFDIAEKSKTYREFISQFPIDYFRSNTYMLNSVWNSYTRNNKIAYEK